MTIEIEIGKVYEIFYNDNNINNDIIEVRAIVDDDHVVFRTFSLVKKRHIYKMEHMYFFEILIEKGYIKESK